MQDNAGIVKQWGKLVIMLETSWMADGWFSEESELHSVDSLCLDSIDRCCG